MQRKLVLGLFALAFGVFALVGNVSAQTATKKPAKKSKTHKKAAEKIITTASGLQYVDYVVGTGAQPTKGQECTINCTGRLTDSTVFWSTLDPKYGAVQPLKFGLGSGLMIAGMDEGVSTMKAGGSRRLIIPSKLAYKEAGRAPSIGPNATLVFDVALLSVK